MKKLALNSTFQEEDHGNQSHHFMANKWGNKANIDLIFLGSKITADDDYSHGIERCLLLGRKAMTNLMAESEEELKNLLMKVKEESEKNGLKTQHSKN